MSEPLDPSAQESFESQDALTSCIYPMTWRDLDFVDDLQYSRGEPMTWEEKMQALALERKIPLEQLPTQQPSIAEIIDNSIRQRTLEALDPENKKADTTFQFTLEDHQWLRHWAWDQPTPPTWEEQMQALAKHRGIEREQLPAEPPSRLN